MNNLKILSATEVRNNWFEVLNWINYEKKEVWVKKNNKIIAKITPSYQPKLDDLETVINNTYGMLKGKIAYFPYEDKRIITAEKKYNRPAKLWKNK